MSKELRVVLSGLGGYGLHYLKYLLDKAPSHVRLVAGVDPAPQRCSRLDDLQARDITVCSSLEDAFRDGSVDLTIIAAPHHYHAAQTCLALEQGSHVLCEKPLCAALPDARLMIDTRDKAGKVVGIGYQWSFTTAIQSLKAAIMAGDFGNPVLMKTIVLWPRDHRYYTRNSWAGRIAMPDGTPVLDSPLNNATAHFLHNMLYLLGPSVDRSARPNAITAERYRANDIESYDTAMLRCDLDNGVEVLFYSTHASEHLYGPVFELQFEKAIVRFDGVTLTAEMAGSSPRAFGSPDSEPHVKLESMVRSVSAVSTPECGIEAALSQTVCVLGAQSSREIVAFDPAIVRTEEGPDNSRRWVDGLDTAMKECYARGVLPSEAAYPWAVAGSKVGLGDLFSQVSGPA